MKQFKINTVHKNAEQHASKDAKQLSSSDLLTNEDYDLFNLGGYKANTQSLPTPRKGNCIRVTKSAQADYF
jgi:hypothetical protein